MILIVGETPGGGGTIARLASFVDLSESVFVSRLVWVNLWPHEGSDPVRYARFVEQGAQPGDVIVMLGRRVAEAFALSDLPPLGIVTRSAGSGPVILALPHPSGRNRWWNDRDNAASGRDAFRSAWFRTSAE